MCNIFLSFHPYLFVSPTFNKCLNCRINIKDIKIVKNTHHLFIKINPIFMAFFSCTKIIGDWGGLIFILKNTGLNQIFSPF